MSTAMPPERTSGPHAEQLSPGGFHPPRADRLFFAVLPDAATQDRLATLARSLRDAFGLRGPPRPTAQLHVTLHFLGDYAGLPAGVVEAALAAAEGVSLAPFKARFGHLESFGVRQRDPLLALLQDEPQASGWMGLHDRLGAHLATAGLLRREPPFRPHVTLLYDTRVVAPRTVEPVSWTVSEFVLIHSVVGHPGYRLLGRWPLQP